MACCLAEIMWSGHVRGGHAGLCGILWVCVPSLCQKQRPARAESARGRRGMPSEQAPVAWPHFHARGALSTPALFFECTLPAVPHSAAHTHRKPQEVRLRNAQARSKAACLRTKRTHPLALRGTCACPKRRRPTHTRTHAYGAQHPRVLPMQASQQAHAHAHPPIHDPHL